MDFTEYIKPELLILIPVLYVIGMAVKKTALIADKLIPLVVGAIGILLSVIYVLATTALGSPQAIAMAIFTALTQGVLVGGASVYANQIFKQFKNNNTNSPQQTTNPTESSEDSKTKENGENNETGIYFYGSGWNDFRSERGNHKGGGTCTFVLWNPG